MKTHQRLSKQAARPQIHDALCVLAATTDLERIAKSVLSPDCFDIERLRSIISNHRTNCPADFGDAEPLLEVKLSGSVECQVMHPHGGGRGYIDVLIKSHIEILNYREVYSQVARREGVTTRFQDGAVIVECKTEDEKWSGGDVIRQMGIYADSLGMRASKVLYVSHDSTVPAYTEQLLQMSDIVLIRAPFTQNCARNDPRISLF